MDLFFLVNNPSSTRLNVELTANVRCSLVRGYKDGKPSIRKVLNDCTRCYRSSATKEKKEKLSAFRISLRTR